MRNGIDGLITIINGTFGLDPAEEGSIFLFCGRKTDRIKALLFEGDGWLLCYKRLTGTGRFQWPRSRQAGSQDADTEAVPLVDGRAFIGAEESDIAAKA